MCECYWCKSSNFCFMRILKCKSFKPIEDSAIAKTIQKNNTESEDINENDTL